MTHEERHARREQIRERVEAGERVDDLAKEFKLSKGSVLACCPSPKIEKNRRREAVRQRLIAGEKAGDLAIEFGLSKTYVLQCCPHAKRVQPPQRSRRRPGTLLSSRTYLICAALWNTSRTLEDIAGEFEISCQRVQQIYSSAREAGIPVPERPRFPARKTSGQA